MSTPLNPGLYAALCDAFGTVRIANEGQPYRSTIVRDLVAQPDARYGRRRVKTLNGGEEYAVCCPECGDQRFRLWINHRFNTDVAGVRMKFLAVCFNENCQQNRGFWSRLQQRISQGKTNAPLYQVRDAPVIDQDFKPQPQPLPGVCVPLHELGAQHLAVQYVEARGFCAAELGRVWDVSFCEYSSVLPAENRLVFPIYDDYDGRVTRMNWQARYLTPEIVAAVKAGQPEAPIIKARRARKYYNAPGSKLKWHLYNGWRARADSSLVVICEGVFDAIRLGPECPVALFGKTCGEMQLQQLWKNWGALGGIGVTALDPEVVRERTALLTAMANWAQVIDLKLPADTDVGVTPRSTLLALIRSYLRA